VTKIVLHYEGAIMAKRNIDAIREELERLRGTLDITIIIKLGGTSIDDLDVDCLTVEENQDLYFELDDARDTLFDTAYDVIKDAFNNPELDGDSDPDEEDAKWEAEQEAKRPQRLADERAALLRKFAEVDAELEDLNSTLIA
jgi:hypothetical protein